MQQTTRPAVKKRRPGIRRMMTHIIVFALLGSVLLGLGLYGYQTLERRTLDEKQTARIEAHLNASVKEAQDLARSADGARYTQLTLAAATPGLPTSSASRSSMAPSPPTAMIGGHSPNSSSVNWRQSKAVKKEKS